MYSKNKKPLRLGRVFCFVTHYWMLSPVLFGTLLITRIMSTLVDVIVPMTAGNQVDVVVINSARYPSPALYALARLIGLAATFQISRQLVVCGYHIDKLP